MKFLVLLALVAVAAAADYSYSKPHITIVSQSDVRNAADASNSFNYAGSDGTTRSESGSQNYGQNNQGTVYWISPEGQKFTLSWVAGPQGFVPSGDHLPKPVEPIHPAPYTIHHN